MPLGASLFVSDLRCDPKAFHGELVPLKVEGNLVKVNVTVEGGASGAAQAPPSMDPAAGEKGKTEYEGAEIVCDPIDENGNAYCHKKGE